MDGISHSKSILATILIESLPFPLQKPWQNIKMLLLLLIKSLKNTFAFILQFSFLLYISIFFSIYIPFGLWFFIQLFKVFYDLIVEKKFNFKRIMGDGGMPSSHAAVTSSLAVLTGKELGFDSPMFAIALILAFVVMYDAAGVRRAAGKQAKLLNKLVETPGLKTEEVQERLVEVLGHTPIQVFVGAFIGIIAGIIL